MSTVPCSLFISRVPTFLPLPLQEAFKALFRLEA